VDRPETRYVTVEDADVAYQVVGDGPIDLLFCWGLGSHIDLAWDEATTYPEFFRTLASFTRLILYDRRGMGASDGVPAGAFPTWESWAEDTGAVLDAVGSERAASLGDRRWRLLLDAHDPAVREQLRRFRGREVKTTGDGFLASFDGPARSIRCAETIVDVTKTLGLDVRVGLHTGECEVRADDLGGLAVHIAARVGALATSGEVLVSGTVGDLVAGSGIEFRDRGEHDLKGVPGVWRLFALAR